MHKPCPRKLFSSNCQFAVWFSRPFNNVLFKRIARLRLNYHLTEGADHRAGVSIKNQESKKKKYLFVPNST